MPTRAKTGSKVKPEIGTYPNATKPRKSPRISSNNEIIIVIFLGGLQGTFLPPFF
jgi:hypothetical protein